ncbi:MAG TPA: DUF2141 domain-containing protein [Allosphingosinicella sp.]|jgi:uncharacterized protein (DUF2141 family)|nr:DUF2141 domain-containing protein [Allosphingosinicella sp.]
MYRPLLLAPLLLALVGARAPTADFEVSIEKLRNRKGLLHLCLTREPAHFPDCRSDPRAVTRTAPAANGPIRIMGLAPGGYALAVFHDENRNRKLDTLIGIPREGFGFSRNPVVRFGAPKFRQVRIDLGPGFTRETVRMQYLL